MAASFLKQCKSVFIRLLVFSVMLLPAWMWIAWRLTSHRRLVIAIIDKTVLTKKGQEHISLNWILNQEKFTKNNTEGYQCDRDYFGFFPLRNDTFRIKGLERFNKAQLRQLSNDADAAYLTDAYGISNNDWYRRQDAAERSGILYGGMSPQDLYFLQSMQDMHKLIITEFNCLESPTPVPVRKAFEKSFGVYWTGWVGRYFDSFDTVRNRELPRWLIENYKRQHDGKWPFTKSGIAFIYMDDRIVILENGTHLNKEFPYIFSDEEGQRHYGLPANIRYTYWFDIMKADTLYNHIIARYEITANENGKKELRINGLDTVFPAIIVHINKDYRFFYFSGDFCDNPIGLTTSYFKGIHYFQWLMYNKRDPMERESFFWKAYRPLMTRILNDYYRDHFGK